MVKKKKKIIEKEDIEKRDRNLRVSLKPFRSLT